MSSIANKRWIYWALQFLGWGSVLSTGLIARYFRTGKVLFIDAQQTLMFLAAALIITEAYRLLIIKFDWFNKPLNRAIPIMALGSLISSTALLAINILIDAIYESESEQIFRDAAKMINGSISLFILTTIWTIAYYGFHFFDKSRKQEVKNLQLASSQKESELSNLKNQLNPHFMFNAMNSIRALVDEDPVLAKQSITQLSNLLRNTLQLGKKRKVKLHEEIKIVNDYLALEKIRFEERLNYSESLPERLVSSKVPPLIIQTLMENAIKHGISKLAKGGNVDLIVSQREEKLYIEVWNDGVYNESQKPEVGIGLVNSRKRLDILYGSEGSLKINNENNRVVTRVIIPFEE